MKLTEEEKLDLIIRRMQTDDSVDAPAELQKYAKDLFRARLVEAPGLLKRIVAVLTADLTAGRPAFGERSASASAARQMLFTADDNALDLRITETGDERSLRGQVLGEGFDNARVTVESNGATFEGSTDDDGEFEIDGVPAGHASLAISNWDTEIVVRLDI